MVSSPRRPLVLATALFAGAILLGLGTGAMVGMRQRDRATDSAAVPTRPTTSSGADAGGSKPTPSTPTAESSSPSGPTARADTDLEPGTRSDVGYLIGSRSRTDGTHVNFDRVQVITGKSTGKSHGKSAQKGAKKGVQRPSTGGDVIINQNSRIRDLVLSPEVQVYGQVQLAGTTETQRIPVSTLLAALPVKGRTVPLDLRYDALGYVIEIRERP